MCPSLDNIGYSGALHKHDGHIIYIDKLDP